MFLKVIQIFICFEISYGQKCEKCDNFTNLTTPQICIILHQFNFYVLLICGKKLVTIKLSDHFQDFYKLKFL